MTLYTLIDILVKTAGNFLLVCDSHCDLIPIFICIIYPPLLLPLWHQCAYQKNINCVPIIRFGHCRKTPNISGLNQAEIFLSLDNCLNIVIWGLTWLLYSIRDSVYPLSFLYHFLHMASILWFVITGPAAWALPTSRKRRRESGGFLSFNSSGKKLHRVITSYLLGQKTWFFMFSERPFCVPLWFFPRMHFPFICCLDL